MSKKIKLGVNAANAFSIPVSVPRESVPSKVVFDVLDVKQFVKNSVDGLVVSDDVYAAMIADTNLAALVAAGLVVVV